MMLSAVILTHNEEDTIARALRSITWADEIILIDTSDDQTLKIAKTRISSQKLHIFKVKERNDFSYLRNFALSKATHEWVFFLDADEEVTPGLAHEIKEAIRDEHVNGFIMKRRDYFLGRWLRCGETAHTKLLKLGRKNAGKWERKVHELWKINGEINTLFHPLNHYPHPTVGEFLARVERWSTLDAQVFLAQGKQSSWWKIIVYPSGKFFLNYILRLGFLDGVPGLIMALMMSFHSFLTRAKMYVGY